MSEPEGFVGRWARRKQEAKAEEPVDAKDSLKPAETEAAVAKVPDEEKKEQPEFDISTLPSIESIVAKTDIRAFLSAGVPAHLTQAALRRAWSADPAIRDYIGLSENSWDFNATDSMHGFGPLQPNDNVRQMVSDVFKGITENEPQSKVASAEMQSEVQPEPEQSEVSDTASPNPEAGTEDPSRNGEISSADDPQINEPNEELAETDSAPQHEPLDEEIVDPAPRRRHGGALPT